MIQHVFSVGDCIFDDTALRVPFTLESFSLLTGHIHLGGILNSGAAIIGGQWD